MLIKTGFEYGMLVSISRAYRALNQYTHTEEFNLSDGHALGSNRGQPASWNNVLTIKLSSL